MNRSKKKLNELIYLNIKKFLAFLGLLKKSEKFCLRLEYIIMDIIVEKKMEMDFIMKKIILIKNTKEIIIDIIS